MGVGSDYDARPGQEAQAHRVAAERQAAATERLAAAAERANRIAFLGALPDMPMSDLSDEMQHIVARVRQQVEGEFLADLERKDLPETGARGGMSGNPRGGTTESVMRVALTKLVEGRGAGLDVSYEEVRRFGDSLPPLDVLHDPVRMRFTIQPTERI